MTDASEAPTPRESTMVDRGRYFRDLCSQNARVLDRKADDAIAVGRPVPRARLLAGRFVSLVEVFESWARGEATIEQRGEDVARYRTALSEAREFGVG